MGEKGEGSELEYRKIGSARLFHRLALAFFSEHKKNPLLLHASCCGWRAGERDKEHELQEKDNTGNSEEGDEEAMELHHETNNAQEEAEKKK